MHVALHTPERFFLQVSRDRGLDAGTRKALQLSTKYKDYTGEGGPTAYLAATAKWARMLRSGEKPSHKSKCKRAAAAEGGQGGASSADTATSWMEAAVEADGQVE